LDIKQWLCIHGHCHSLHRKQRETRCVINQCPKLIWFNFTAEESLIDFRELMGEHSGENMAAAVWETLEKFGLIGRVSAPSPETNSRLKLIQITAFVMDNATNNDTLVAAFARRCRALKIPFSAVHGRMRCMPHTIHLAALKVHLSFIYQTCLSCLTDFSCWRPLVLSPRKRNRRPSPERQHTRMPQRNLWTVHRILRPLYRGTPRTVTS
jgi:hypothetical protein